MIELEEKCRKIKSLIQEKKKLPPEVREEEPEFTNYSVAALKKELEDLEEHQKSEESKYKKLI